MTAALVEVPCPNCRASSSTPWAEENGYHATQCTDCGFVYVSPRVPDDAVSEAARTGLHETEGGKMTVLGRFRRDKIRVYRDRLSELYPNGELSARPWSWLDVGTGYGEFLLAIRDLVPEGSRLEGLEPCIPKAEKARSLELDVSDRELDAITERFDAVSMINVFSHLPDPRAFFMQLAGLLKPGGELFVVTGNGADVPAEDYPRPYYLPDHLVFAGEQHLEGMLSDSGFEMVRIHRYREFLPENALVFIAKNAVKTVLRRPHTPWKAALFRKETSFRSLFVRARLKE